MQTVEAVIHGQVFRKRTHKGKRFIAYAQSETDLKVCIFKTAKAAEDWGFWMRDNYEYLAHGFAEGRVL